MDVEVIAVFIPIITVIVSGIVVVGWVYLNYKQKQAIQETYRLALEKGTELTPEFIRQLGVKEVSKDRDLRRGLVWLGIALGFGSLALLIPEDEATGPMLGVAAFPLFIGLAFLLMHRFGNKSES